MAFRKTISIIEAPTNLGLMPPAPDKLPGTYQAPDAFKAAQIGARLRAQDAGRVVAPVYRPDIDEETGIRNTAALRGYSTRLAEAVAQELKRDRFTMVVGGDCSVLLGSAMALKKLGRYGLVFIDGHTDFHTPQTSRTGGAAGMDLALATGYGPEILTNIGGMKPYIRASDVVLLGNRDISDPAKYPARHIFQTPIQLLPLDKLRAQGIDSVVHQTLERYEDSAVSGFFIHFDVDVLDTKTMPAVDSPMPGGMSYTEASRLLKGLLKSDLVVGMNITIFDPDLDPDGSIARGFVNFLVDSFSIIDG